MRSFRVVRLFSVCSAWTTPRTPEKIDIFNAREMKQMTVRCQDMILPLRVLRAVPSENSTIADESEIECYQECFSGIASSLGSADSSLIPNIAGEQQVYSTVVVCWRLLPTRQGGRKKLPRPTDAARDAGTVGASSQELTLSLKYAYSVMETAQISTASTADSLRSRQYALSEHLNTSYADNDSL
jgi:hypothetical protein